jgi:hypothetical protein
MASFWKLATSLDKVLNPRPLRCLVLSPLWLLHPLLLCLVLPFICTSSQAMAQMGLPRPPCSLPAPKRILLAEAQASLAMQ